MARSLKKGPYINERLLQKIQQQIEAKKFQPIKTYARNSQIAPIMVGQKISIYDGQRFREVSITEGMVGHRLGEFAPTRRFRTHGKITKRIESKT